ncbi:MAG: tetratricopeptide repeat protein [Comamonadaceae bacterium]|nr:tetratricopeptide repeat protein [Comamonadaceae bacterium]
MEETFHEEFINLKEELGIDMDAFSDNTELTDNQPKEDVKTLEEMFREFKKGVEQQISQEDYETHYNLGIAYKEMGLYHEAIEEFAKASHETRRYIDCCFMIASVYEDIGDVKQVVEWLGNGIGKAGFPEKGRETSDVRSFGTLLEKSGEPQRAKEFYKRLYAIAPGYRDVAKKI